MSQSRFARDQNANLAAVSFDELLNARLEQALKAFAEIHLPQKGAPQVAKSASTNPPTFEPRWIPSKWICERCYKGCSGQLNKFLCSFLPKATDYGEQLAATISELKSKQIKDIFNYLSGAPISDIIFKEELKKQLTENRNKLTRKIYDVLKIHKGCIFTKLGSPIPCRYDFASKRYIPVVQKRGDYIRLRNCEWAIPSDVQFHEFIITAYVDNVQRKRMIHKLDLKSGRKTLLHKGIMQKK